MKILAIIMILIFAAIGAMLFSGPERATWIIYCKDGSVYYYDEFDKIKVADECDEVFDDLAGQYNLRIMFGIPEDIREGK